MIGYFSSIRWSKTNLSYVVCHTQPKMVPPPQHRETGAEVVEARDDLYFLDVEDKEARWSSYPHREKLGWPDGLLTLGLRLAFEKAGFTSMTAALLESRREPIELGPHRWHTTVEDYPTLWEHILE